ncbi:MAG: acylphosphatase [Methylocystis sp.]|nr:acylphosphatase [Methylocystis sp.]
MSKRERRIVRIVVEGCVQGVGYRAFVAREAGRFGLQGWVRNRRDGAVEMVLAGPPAAVVATEQSCRRGPMLARVDALRIEDADEQALQEGGGERGFVVAF